jgi:hypothetical protein
MCGVFLCQLIGTHPNDRWFPKDRMKRTYLQDDSLPFRVRARIMGEANREAQLDVYRSLSR